MEGKKVKAFYWHKQGIYIDDLIDDLNTVLVGAPIDATSIIGKPELNVSREIVRSYDSYHGDNVFSTIFTVEVKIFYA